MLNPSQFLQRLQRAHDYRDQIAHVRELPARPPRFREPANPPSPELWQRVQNLGINRLFTHQADAIDAVADGNHVALVTTTASGKTLCYNLPVIDRLLKNPRGRAFYLFPTKALAQDQLGKLQELQVFPNVRFATYDGDTPQRERPAIRKSAHIVLTNPDMLHIGILPNHESWAAFFRGLEFVIIDEMHTYRGIFGAHVGNILRRLRRIAEFHGASPQFICCSATIGNPAELARELTGLECKVIDNDGSPKGDRTIVFWNPPEIGNGERRSANSETTDLFTSLVSDGVRNIAFTRARVTAELLLRYSRKAFERGPADLGGRVEAYRGGYSPDERRQIEQRLFHGELVGVAATNALELGVDIGGLDAVVMNGYPGTIASLWQQAGRAGRAQDPSLALMVAHNDPLEQYIVRHPEIVLDTAHESVKTNPRNPYVLASHLRCAAHERPIAPNEATLFGPDAIKTLEDLEGQGALVYRQGRWFHPFSNNPAGQVDIRSASGEVYTIVNMATRRPMGTLEGARAFAVIHPGAIYLHRGDAFEVKELDLVQKEALVETSFADYYTDAYADTIIDINHVIDERELGEGTVALGAITVTEQVMGYRKKALFTEQILGYHELDLPPRSFDTIGVWIRLPKPPENKNATEEEEEAVNLAIASGAHAIEHVAASMVPALVSCDRNDLGSAWYSLHPDLMSPGVFVFDTAPGGVGLAEEAFHRAEEWLRSVRQVISECQCDGGCPGCVLSARCPSRNQFVSKLFALELLKKLLPEK